MNRYWIFIKCSHCNFNFIVGVVYFPISVDYCEMVQLLDNLLNKISVDYPNVPLFMGGNFNARIGILNQLYEFSLPSDCNVSFSRSSMDRVTNRRGIALTDCFESFDLAVLNGRCSSDSPANFTFVGHQGNSVIELFFLLFGFYEFDTRPRFASLAYNCGSSTGGHFVSRRRWRVGGD